MPPKKIPWILYAALGTSAIFGVWLAAGYVGAASKAEFVVEVERRSLQTAILHRTSSLHVLPQSESQSASGISTIMKSPARGRVPGPLQVRGPETNVTTGGSPSSIEEKNAAVNSTFLRLQANTKSMQQLSTESQGECVWVNRTIKSELLIKSQSPYFLTAVLLLRIYKEDKAKLTTRELMQWLLYMRYIGVEHVYMYDAFYTRDEAQFEHLGQFLKDKYVTYIDWHMHNPYTISGTQVTAYQHCIDNYGAESTWQMAVDIDEYPFSPIDQQPGSVVRFIEKFSSKNPMVSEITMQNFLFLGKPLERELLMERLWRRDPKPSNALVKPIYRPANVRASIHHNRMLRGISTNAPYQELRMNHYWGARLQNWEEDTPEILSRTVEDRSMETVTDEFHRCEAHIRPYIG